MRYRVWQSRKDSSLHLLSAEGSAALESLPAAIQNLGPWTGGAEGDVHRLRLPYRVMLGEQGFAIISAHVSQLQLENVTSVHALHPPTPMAAVQRLGRGAAAWRLRQKTCPRCGVRGGSIERHRRLATQQSLTRMTP